MWSSSPSRVRIERKRHVVEAPPDLPPSGPPDSSSSSSSDEEKTTHRAVFTAIPAKPSPPVECSSEPLRSVRAAAEASTPRFLHTPLTQRTSYVEEPASTTTTLERRPHDKEKAAAAAAAGYGSVGQMQLAHFVHNMPVEPVEIDCEARPSKLGFMSEAFRMLLWSLGKSIANHNITYIVIALLSFSVSVLCAVFFRQYFVFASPLPFLLQNSAENDQLSNVYSMQRIPQHFKSANPAFNALRLADENEYAVIFSASDAVETLLDREITSQFIALKKKLEMYGNENKIFVECVDECAAERDVLDRIVKKSHQVSLTYPESFVATSRDSANLTRVFVGAAIGGVESDSDGDVVAAKSLLMRFRVNDDVADEKRRAWIAYLHQQVEQTRVENVSLSLWSPTKVDEAVEAELLRAHRYLALSVLMSSVFCTVVCSMMNAYQAKPMVGLHMPVSIVCSCIGAFCLDFISRRGINVLLFPAAYSVGGIALLWLFVLHCAWHRYSNVALHPTEKLAFILAHDGPLVLSSALVLALSAGCAWFMSPIAVLSSTLFFLCGAVALLLIFALLYHSTFVYAGGRREASGVKWFHCCQRGDTHFSAPNMSGYSTSALFALHDRLIEKGASAIRPLALVVCSARARYLTAVLMTALLIFSVWGCLNARVELRQEDFLPPSSQLGSFVNRYKSGFSRSIHYLELSIDQPIEYEDVATRRRILSILDAAVADGYTNRVVSWLSDFEKFEKSTVYEVNENTFVPIVNMVFVKSEPYKRYAADIVFDRFQTQIVKSRMYLELSAKGVAHKAALVRNLLEQSTRERLPLSVAAPFSASLQHDVHIVQNVMLILAVLLVGFVFLSMLFFAQPSLTMSLLVSSILVFVETIGIASHLDVPFNAITAAVALSSNALLAAIVMAFCYCYSVQPAAPNAVQRVQYALQATLFPVACACFVPPLTFLPLLWSADAVLISQLWTLLLLGSATAFVHYLFLLPNLMFFFSSTVPKCSATNCVDACCDTDNQSSIYYIPATSRSLVHPANQIYRSASCAYSIPISAPNYLAITAPPGSSTPSQYAHHPHDMHSMRARSRTRIVAESANDSSAASTPRRQRNRRRHRSASNGSSIYEAMPSPKRNASPRTRAMSNDSWRAATNEPVFIYPPSFTTQRL